MKVTMVHRGPTREAKKIRQARVSTPSDKYRRHRNKDRIYYRALKRLALAPAAITTKE